MENTSVFRRPYDLSDEATTFGYTEPLNDIDTVATRNAGQAYTAMSPSRNASRMGGPAKRDLMAMTRVMDLTSNLQTEQDAKEAAEQKATEEEAERLRRQRNAKWEAVKARMSARPVPPHSVRAYDSDLSSDSEDDEAYDDVKSVRTTRSTTTTRTALDALAPSVSEARALRRGPFHDVETTPQRFWRFVYNWGMYFVYAMSNSVMPGMDARKGADSREYYSPKKYS